MIIIMKPTATQADVQTICDWITSLRYQPRVTTGYLARYAKQVSSGMKGAVLS